MHAKWINLSFSFVILIYFFFMQYLFFLCAKIIKKMSLHFYAKIKNKLNYKGFYSKYIYLIMHAKFINL